MRDRLDDGIVFPARDPGPADRVPSDGLPGPAFASPDAGGTRGSGVFPMPRVPSYTAVAPANP